MKACDVKLFQHLLFSQWSRWRLSQNTVCRFRQIECLRGLGVIRAFGWRAPNASWSDLRRVLITFHTQTQMGRINQNNGTACSLSVVLFLSWNSSLMISNQCCAHAQRQIIRTQCFLSQKQTDDGYSQHSQSDDKIESTLGGGSRACTASRYEAMSNY